MARAILNLKIVSGPNEGQTATFQPGQDIHLGRNPKCDIVLSDSAASNRHCLIKVAESGVYIEDLQSSNGTFINGKRITRAVAEREVVLLIGRSKIALSWAALAGDASSSTMESRPTKRIQYESDSGSGMKTPVRNLNPGAKPVHQMSTKDARKILRQDLAFAESLVGRELAGCKLEQLIGLGGAGAVFRGIDLTADNRQVAVKLVLKRFAQNSNLLRRFLREAKLGLKLKHPNLIDMIRTGHEDEFPYIIMAFLSGKDMRRLKESGRTFSTADVVRYIAPICDAVQVVHDAGVVHRDIKPANIMVTQQDIPILLDLGAARHVEESDASGLTRSGSYLGTVTYMAPEQTEDARSVDNRADIYSLGATCFYLLSGRSPFTGKNGLEVIRKIRTEEPPNIRELNQEVPPEMAALINRALAKKPEDRFQAAAEMKQAIAKID